MDYILFLGVGQGLFLAAILPVISKSNTKANRILSILLVLVSIILFLKILLPGISDHIAVFFWGYLDSLALLFGPLYYLYFKRLLFAQSQGKLHFLHFLPALLHALYITCRVILFSGSELLELFQSGRLFPVWVFVSSLLTSSYIGYIILSIRLIVRYRRKQNLQISYKTPLGLSLVLLVCILMSILLWIFWIIDFLFGIKLFVFTDTNIGWLIIPILTYFLGYKAILHQEVFRLTQHTSNGTPRMDNDSSQKLLKSLVDYMETEKPYLDPKITLIQLADMLNTTSNKLSWIINTTYSCNFYDYINRYRTRTFIKKLHAGYHINRTVISLAYESGFNSKSTFNKVFRKTMHDSPRNYIKSLSAKATE